MNINSTSQIIPFIGLSTSLAYVFANMYMVCMLVLGIAWKTNRKSSFRLMSDKSRINNIIYYGWPILFYITNLLTIYGTVLQMMIIMNLTNRPNFIDDLFPWCLTCDMSIFRLSNISFIDFHLLHDRIVSVKLLFL